MILGEYINLSRPPFFPMFVEDNNSTLPAKGYYIDKALRAGGKFSHSGGGGEWDRIFEPWCKAVVWLC